MQKQPEELTEEQSQTHNKRPTDCEKLHWPMWSGMEILNTISSDCAYGHCDGGGMVTLRNPTTGYIASQQCLCFESLRQQRRMKYAQIPKEFAGLTLNSFDTSLYGKHQPDAVAAKRAAGALVSRYLEVRPEGLGLYLYSKTTGSGKTRLAASIGNALVSVHKVPVRFITTLDLLEVLKRSYRSNKEGMYSEDEGVIEQAGRIDVLILDDIGVERPDNAWVNETFYQLFNTRLIQKRVTILTSNCSPDELQLDHRIKTRIKAMTYPVHMPEEDVRSKLADTTREGMRQLLFGETEKPDLRLVGGAE